MSLKQLQELRLSLNLEYEDSRNDFVANVLRNKNFRIQREFPAGMSETGKIDIKINDDKNETIAIY